MTKYRLKQLIAEKEFNEGVNISLSDLSKELGIARSTLSKMSNNKGKGIHTEVIEKLCKYFGVSCDELVTFVDEPNKESEDESPESETQESPEPESSK